MDGLKGREESFRSDVVLEWWVNFASMVVVVVVVVVVLMVMIAMDQRLGFVVCHGDIRRLSRER